MRIITGAAMDGTAVGTVATFGTAAVETAAVDVGAAFFGDICRISVKLAARGDNNTGG